MKFKYFLPIFFLILINYSCKEHKVKEINEINVKKSLINKYFKKADSIILKYKKSNYPKLIRDISFNNDYIYVLGINEKFPIVKFDISGKFIKNISRKGNGPNEFNFNPSKIASDKDLLVVLSSNFNMLYLFKNDNFVKKFQFFNIKNNSNTIKRKDILRTKDVALINNQIILFCSGFHFTGKHIVVLDTNFTIKKGYINLPDNNSLTALIPMSFWAVQENNDFFISHIQYPFVFYTFKVGNDSILNINEINNVIPKNYKLIDENLTLEHVLKKYDNNKRLKIYESFSKIWFVIKNENYYIGIYRTDELGNKANYYLFIIRNDKIILDKKFSDVFEIMFIIPTNNTLYMQKFNKSNYFVKLYKLEIKKNVNPL